MASDPVIESVRALIDRTGMLRPGERVLCACSGGGDSTALLLALDELGFGPLRAVYVDHGLRTGTDEEAALVARHAEGLGASFERCVVSVERRGNLLARAREARYAALVLAARRWGAKHLAVGHTATDQAETVAFRLLRGDLAQALAGMAARRPAGDGLTLIRPLLDVRREAVAGFVARRGLEFVSDPTNLRAEFTRTRLRAALAERPDALERAIQLSRRTNEWIGDIDRQLDRLLDQSRGAPFEHLSAAAVVAAGPDVALRLLRAAGLHRAGGRHAAALIALCASPRGSRQLDLGGGLVAARCYGELRIGPPQEAEPGDVELEIPGCGCYTLLGHRVVIQARRGSPGCALPAAPWPWKLRNLRPGDRLKAARGHRKLQDLLTDWKVPRAERRHLPLVEAGGQVLWIGWPAGARFAVAETAPPRTVTLELDGEPG